MPASRRRVSGDVDHGVREKCGLTPAYSRVCAAGGCGRAVDRQRERYPARGATADDAAALLDQEALRVQAAGDRGRAAAAGERKGREQDEGAEPAW